MSVVVSGRRSPRFTSSSSLAAGGDPVAMQAALVVGALAMVVPTPTPRVSAPPNFVAPTPKPLTMTRPEEQLPGLITGGLALALRIATGVFVLGWSPKLLTGDAAGSIGVENGKYGFKVGPLAFRDESSLLVDVPRPEQPLILYVACTWAQTTVFHPPRL